MSEKNPMLSVGRKYRIVYKSELQRIKREAVMVFLGSSDSGLFWDLRPVAGTQQMPRHWLISAEEVNMSEMVCFDKIWKEEG